MFLMFYRFSYFYRSRDVINDVIISLNGINEAISHMTDFFFKNVGIPVYARVSHFILTR